MSEPEVVESTAVEQPPQDANNPDNPNNPNNPNNEGTPQDTSEDPTPTEPDQTIDPNNDLTTDNSNNDQPNDNEQAPHRKIPKVSTAPTNDEYTAPEVVERKAHSDVREWACGVCTYLNVELGQTQCDMCGLERTEAVDKIAVERVKTLMINAGYSPDDSKTHKKKADRRDHACNICFDNFARKDMFKNECAAEYDHHFCNACVTAYVEHEISEGRVGTIRCPGAAQGDCKTYICAKKVRNLVSEETFAKYERFRMMQENKNTRACPKCDTLNVGAPARPDITCKECGEWYCFNHDQAHPQDESCDAYNSRMALVFAQDIAFKNRTSIKCPSCSVPIEKGRGCNHMTCRNCGCDFCYLCGGRYWNNWHYSMSNWLGCRGMRGNSGLPPNFRGQWWRKTGRLCCWLPFYSGLTGLCLCSYMVAGVGVAVNTPCWVMCCPLMCARYWYEDQDICDMCPSNPNLCCCCPIINLNLCGYFIAYVDCMEGVEWVGGCCCVQSECIDHEACLELPEDWCREVPLGFCPDNCCN